jgi:hypothetical protein
VSGTGDSAVETESSNYCLKSVMLAPFLPQLVQYRDNVQLDIERTLGVKVT